MHDLVDVHCHLTHEAFARDLPAVLGRAREAGVTRLICMGETPADNLEVLALSRAHPELLAGFGHYPAHLDESMVEETLALLRAHVHEVVALGEVGIDHRLAADPEERGRQHEIFKRLIEVSLELDLPLSVHSRSAGHHALRLLKDNGARRVCLHAFDGKAGYAAEAAEAGYYLSIPPSVVRSPQKQKLIRRVPLERLLLESDAPVLGPDAGQRNEPANLSLVAEAIAEIKNLSRDEVCQTIRANTRALFGV